MKRAALAQAARSWYAYAFQIPRASDAVVRALSRARLADDRRGIALSPTLPDDAVDGLNLYRANLFRGGRSIPGGARTDVPVLLVVPLRDRYVTPALATAAERYAARLRRVDLDAGHWVIRSRPDEVAALIAAHVGDHAEPRRGG
jgi:pimeloyl-ACP methyl ester carboxylesterase